ncbi:hypothetical protein [Oceanobacter mangrovi]|uniref:hypothetical protein n=1 Tax=Oceanobacter mangrovi TaxID=2862510 RepID=UPI001C8ED9BF|nr:hypothetical protein [Oceanobacter mangrovi]
MQPIDHGSYANKLTNDVSNQQFVADGDSENVIRVEDGAHVVANLIRVEKTAGEAPQGDASNFYGANAGVLALDGADLTITNSQINTNANGGNGVFSYGEGTRVHLNNIRIRTLKGNSGGVMVAGGGWMEVANGDIETTGQSAAALRSDRGSGTLIVNGGRYVSHGLGSPAVYSTADIAVANAVLESTGSEAVVIEGRNRVHISNSEVSGFMQRDDADNIQNVMLYQSMSGDAESGESEFMMEGGSLTGHSGDLFYVTNTHAHIQLQNVALHPATNVFLRVAGNSEKRGWGRPGSNGGICETDLIAQQAAGQILVDDISSLVLTMKQASELVGSINPTGAAGNVSVVLDPSSRWTLSADSYISTFSGNLANVDTNGHRLVVGEDVYE